jgi:hypothetical protein
MALVGAPYHQVGANASQGSAYVFLLDSTAPTTSAALAPLANAAGWNNGPVTVTLSASDDLSGVNKTYYRLGDSGAYTQYNAAAKPVVAASGSTNLWYYSTDLAGNLETAKDVTVKIDSIAPTTAAALSASANAAGWYNAPVTVTLHASDTTSGPAGSQYRLSGAATWTPYTAAFLVSTQGTSTWEYRSTDLAGNLEAAKSLTVKLDSVKPTTKAYAAAASKGRKAKLAYLVSDAKPGCGQAVVTLKIYQGKKLRKTLKAGTCASNAKTNYSWRCTLAEGKYTLKVYATDIAGNTQSKVGSAKLTVR